MSKITSKNLAYDSTLPPFLQRLQQDNTGLDGRHERAIARPKRARTAQDEEDDAPAYVNEDTNHTLSKEEYSALMGKKQDPELDAKDSTDPPADLPAGGVPTVEEVNTKAVEKERVAGIGASKKRKVGKVVGGGDVDVEGDVAAAVQKANKIAGLPDKKVEPAKAKKKAKKIKLSFNDDEG